MKRRLACMGLALVMCMSLCSTALAASPNSIDEALLQRGIPQQILDRMSDDTKEHVYNNPSLEYGSSMCMSFNEETGEYSNPTVVTPASEHIPDDDLDLTFSFFYNTNGYKINIIEVTFDYNWNNLPVFRWSDPIAVSWDDEKLRFVPDTSGEVFLAMTVYGTSPKGNFCYLAIDPDSKKVLSLMEQTGYTSDGRAIWTEQVGD